MIETHAAPWWTFQPVIIAFLIVDLLVITASGQQPAPTERKPDGNTTIRAAAGGSEIVVTTTDRLAGAIHSVTWNGQEFINSSDHGRQLQSAASFNCAEHEEFWAERYNPTEAGSRHDGSGPTSTSRLLKIHAEGAELETVTQMAFWLRPGEKSEGRLACNKRLLSDVRLTKHVHIGHKNLPNVLEYSVTFTLPPSERHTIAQFEALTGYMPMEFSAFWAFHADAGKLEELSVGPGEQSLPVVLATKDGRYAMGVFSPDQPSKGYETVGYGRFQFPGDRVTKWNCVFRLHDPAGIPPGDFRYQMYVPIGTLEDVRLALVALAAEFKPTAKQ